MDAGVLHIRLFGELELHLGELLLPFESSRAESLLAYLLLHRDAPQPRQRIAFLLWPDSSESQARTNLRHLLHYLRRALPESERFIDVTPRALQWRPDATYQLDVADFETAFEHGDLRQAVELYRADLLAGSYDDWVIEQRDRLRQHYMLALERLAHAHEERGDYAGAIHYASLLQLYDPLYEESYRLLMRLHNARGDRARAVRVYHECATALERELGVEPSRPTRLAYEALLGPEPERPQEKAAPPAAAERPVRGSAPLVGRAGEWETLTQIWRAVEAGERRFVLIAGEAGIGKTRLAGEFADWCAGRAAVVAEARPYAAEGALALGPILDWLRSDDLALRLDRLDRPSLAQLARLLPELHASYPDLPELEPLPESEQRQRLFDAVARVILAPGAPVLLLLDDIQWTDRETLQLLHYLLRAATRSRLLVIATARQEEVELGHPLRELIAGLRVLDCLTEIELHRLGETDTSLLAAQMTGQALDASDAGRLYQETEGNPLFIVEALRAGWNDARSGSSWQSPRVQAVIEARLAQLSEPARQLVDMAATIGRDFTVEVLQAASAVDTETTIRALDELWRRRIVREQGADAYDFSHDKIREVAYLALSPALRRHHHLQVARALEQLHDHATDQVSGQLAAHYERAGEAEAAARWYLRAAAAAQRMHANSAAVQILERALQCLAALPDTVARQRLELEILTALPAAIAATEGHSWTRVSDIHERALELTRSLAVDPDPRLLYSLALASLSRNEFDASRSFGEQLHRLGERQQDDVIRAQGSYVLGITAFWAGELAAARDWFERAIARCRPEHRATHILHYGHDPESTCLMRLGCALWLLGYPESAVHARERAFAVVEELGDTYSRTLTLMFAALLALEMREPQRMRGYIAQLQAISSDRPHVLATAEAFAGYLDALDGQATSGFERIQRVIDDPGLSELAPGQRTMYYRALVAAHAERGDAKAGLAALERLAALNSGVRLWEAEFHRLRASLLTQLAAPDGEIEAALDAALHAARQQGARLIELRALTDLLAHHRQRGNDPAAGQARAALAALLDASPERCDATDFRAATVALIHRRAPLP